MQPRALVSILSFFPGAMTTQLALSQGMAVKDTDRTADEWIALGETVHGGFGSHIALGIRIGQAALQRLQIVFAMPASDLYEVASSK